MIVTEEFIQENKSSNGGWNFSQIAMLGEQWPPKRGWIERCIGKEITDEDARKFIAYGRQRPSKKERRAIKVGATKSKRGRKKQHEIETAWMKKNSGPAEVIYKAKLNKKKDGFYETDEWRSVRYKALKLHGGRCQCCGRGAAQGVILHVDHIKPRSKFPELALTLENLQVLCEDCNLGKSNKDDTDWRPKLVVDNATPTRRIGIRD